MTGEPNTNDDNARPKIWVLYASQTGNSEQAAHKIVDQIMAGKISNTAAEAIQLDDFLEIKHCPWTSIVIIVLSSYGVGQAPMGGYRFREFCDYLLSNNTNNNNVLLKDMSFALLGLGDSKYTTFFQNPMQTHDALIAAGAKRIGVIGKADASSADQVAIVDEWIANLWGPLNDAIQSKSQQPTPERLAEMQKDTITICAKINPDFRIEPPPGTNRVATPIVIAMLVILLSVMIAMAMRD